MFEALLTKRPMLFNNAFINGIQVRRTFAPEFEPADSLSFAIFHAPLHKKSIYESAKNQEEEHLLPEAHKMF